MNDIQKNFKNVAVEYGVKSATNILKNGCKYADKIKKVAPVGEKIGLAVTTIITLTLATIELNKDLNI